MKKLTLTLVLIACAFAGLAGTNDYYIDMTGAEFDTQQATITNILGQFETYGPTLTNNAAIIVTNTAALAANDVLMANMTNEVLSAGISDVWFGRQTIDTNFTDTTFTDIDLSAYVGTNSAMVMIEVWASTTDTVLMRQNGASNIVDATSATGVAMTLGQIAYMWVPTDTNGVIEADVTVRTEFYLLSFIRRHDFD